MKAFPLTLAKSLALLVLLTLATTTACEKQDEGGTVFISKFPVDCSWVGHDSPALVADLDERLAAYAQTEISADLTHLTDTQRSVLAKLVEVADIMHELFWEQACPCRPEIKHLLEHLPAGSQSASAARYFEINMGPWDRRLDREPFLGSWPHPAGANYYPLDLTGPEKKRIAAGEGQLGELFTMVRRDNAGQLLAVPYAEYFAEPLGRAAELLREAAALTENESLQRFLLARADALLSNDYYESDMLWMDLDSMVEITIGPYETYEDGLFGFKAAFEAFVTVTDPDESERLERFKDELPWLESSLPIPDIYKNPNRGTESPIRVVDEVYAGGDTRAGIQTIAFNLPNDERVRETKGSKKVLLRNVMKAKFDQILTPIARTLVADDQVDDLSAESFFLHTLFHEMSHGLGPGRIVVDGRQTEVRLELKETYSTLEEAKADVMGEWAIFKLQDKGYFPETIYQEQAATYLAGLFRSVRFGLAEGHGQANAIQFNYLLAKGAIGFDPRTGRFRMDVAAFPEAIEELVREICIVQAEGDYAGAQQMIDRYGVMPPVLADALARLQGIQVDIEPQFADLNGGR